MELARHVSRSKAFAIKPDDLSPIPRTHIQSVIGDPSTPVMKWEEEMGESPTACRPVGQDYAVQQQKQGRTFLKAGWKETREELSLDFHVYTMTHTPPNTPHN